LGYRVIEDYKDRLSTCMTIFKFDILIFRVCHSKKLEFEYIGYTWNNASRLGSHTLLSTLCMTLFECDSWIRLFTVNLVKWHTYALHIGDGMIVTSRNGDSEEPDVDSRIEMEFVDQGLTLIMFSTLANSEQSPGKPRCI
jgi:hypothetical protein